MSGTSQRKSYLVGKAFKGFLLASVLTASASQLGTLVDGLILSRFINEEAMSAVNLSSPVIQVLFALCTLLGVGGTMLAGVAIGKHDRSKASEIFSLVLTASITLGVVLGLGGLLFLSPLEGILCPDTSLHQYVRPYLGLMLTGAPIYMAMVVIQMFVTLDGSPRRVTAAVTTATIVNLGLDLLFIVGFGWGMSGAAIATVVSYLAALAVLSGHFKAPETLRYGFPRVFSELKSISWMGIPFGIATVLIAVQMLGNNIVAIRYLGGAGIVVLSICMYLLRFSMIILTGTLESFQPVAAILKGSNDNRGVMMVLLHAYRFMTVSLAILATILVLFPQWIGSLFGIEDPVASSLLRMALPAYACNIILQCAVYLLIPVYQLYSHRGLAMTISLGQPLLPMIFFWLLAAMESRGMNVNPWWGFALGQLALIAIVAPIALTRKGRHWPFLLIPDDHPDRLLDMSLVPSISGMADGLAEIDGWLNEHDVDSHMRMKVVLACEECVKNIIEHGLERGSDKSAIDVRVAIFDSRIDMVIRDEGRPFNPTKQDSASGLGLLIVRKVCDLEKYEHLFHQNILSLSWNR